jgi:putative NIF3 family GTP cyclohydrolase 1 type 2
MGREIGWKVGGGRWKRSDLLIRCESLCQGQEGEIKLVPAGPAVCRKLGIVTGGFGDLDQVEKEGLDTLITGEADYPTEVKARELGINLILAGHRETETFGVESLRGWLRGFGTMKAKSRKNREWPKLRFGFKFRKR